MPRDTFHNLPEDKRDRFVAAALDEFVAHPYDQASISRMVARLGIAKGSVYQYFEDKVDLFVWLVQESGRRKFAAIGGPESVDGPPIEQLRTLYGAGLRFWRNEPRWARIALRALEPSSEPRVAALRAELQRASLAWLEGWLTEAAEAGAIRTDLSPATLAPLVHGMLSDGLLSAVLRAAEVDLTDLPDGPLPLDDNQLDAIVTTALALLEGGLLGQSGSLPGS